MIYKGDNFTDLRGSLKCVNKFNFKNIKRPESVKINDQFAKNLGSKDLNDLKKLINHQIQNQYKMNLDVLIVASTT